MEFLKDNCDTIEEKSYMKPYTPEQLLKMKEELAEASVKIDEIEEKKRLAVSEFKDQISPLEKVRKENIIGIRNKAKYINEPCYKFVDIDKREVGFYNEDGDLIESRPAYSEELQGNIFQVARKTGTNN